jgi:hypothetical protein
MEIQKLSSLKEKRFISLTTFVKAEDECLFYRCNSAL